MHATRQHTLAARQRQRIQEQVQHVDQVVGKQGVNETLSRVYVRSRRFGDLARILTAAVANPADAGIAINLALLLASCRDASVRNGTEAVAVAERAASLSGYGRADVLATLAAAYAEAGRSEKAAGAARQALALAEKAGSADLARFLRAQIAEYAAGKPYRDSRY